MNYYSDPTSSVWLGFMIMGGFVMMAAIGALVATSIYLLRKSRRYPRHAHRRPKTPMRPVEGGLAP
jgi:hypothetical protein